MAMLDLSVASGPTALLSIHTPAVFPDMSNINGSDVCQSHHHGKRAGGHEGQMTGRPRYYQICDGTTQSVRNSHNMNKGLFTRPSLSVDIHVSRLLKSSPGSK